MNQFVDRLEVVRPNYYSQQAPAMPPIDAICHQFQKTKLFSGEKPGNGRMLASKASRPLNVSPART